MPRPLLGVSTSALSDKTALDELLPYEPDVIEFINYPTSALPAIQQFVSRHGIRVALHTPVPYDGRSLLRYDPTSGDRVAAENARRLLRETVRCAELLNALHVVVHFPSPHPPFDVEAFHCHASSFLDAAEEASIRHGVPVLIENLTPNPLCRTAEQYHSILGERPRLGLCLDVGHAHLLQPHDGPVDFVRVMGTRIRSVHLYNTSAGRYATFGHEMVHPVRSTAEGFLDVERLLRSIVSICHPAAVVLEHGPGHGDATATAQWVRAVLARGGDRH